MKMWEVKGSFNRRIFSGADLTHYVEYQYKGPSCLIKKVVVCGYDGEVKLCIETSSYKAFDHLDAAVQRRGFPAQDTLDCATRNLSVSCKNNDKARLVLFLQTISSEVNEVREIFSNLFKDLGIDFMSQSKYELPRWQKHGDFNRVFNIGTDLNRQVTYKRKSTCIQMVSQIELFGYKGGSYRVVIKVINKDIYDKLSQAVQHQGFPKGDFIDRDFLNLRFLDDSHDKSRLSEYLQIIMSEAEELDELREEVADTLGMPLLKEEDLVLPPKAAVSISSEELQTELSAHQGKKTALCQGPSVTLELSAKKEEIYNMHDELDEIFQIAEAEIQKIVNNLDEQHSLERTRSIIAKDQNRMKQLIGIIKRIDVMVPYLSGAFAFMEPYIQKHEAAKFQLSESMCGAVVFVTQGDLRRASGQSLSLIRKLQARLLELLQEKITILKARDIPGEEDMPTCAEVTFLHDVLLIAMHDCSWSKPSLAPFRNGPLRPRAMLLGKILQSLNDIEQATAETSDREKQKKIFYEYQEKISDETLEKKLTFSDSAIWNIVEKVGIKNKNCEVSHVKEIIKRLVQAEYIIISKFQPYINDMYDRFYAELKFIGCDGIREELIMLRDRLNALINHKADNEAYSKFHVRVSWLIIMTKKLKNADLSTEVERHKLKEQCAVGGCKIYQSELTTVLSKIDGKHKDVALESLRRIIFIMKYIVSEMCSSLSELQEASQVGLFSNHGRHAALSEGVSGTLALTHT